MNTKRTKYSIEWKHEQQETHGGWAQKHADGWRWHYIQHGTEYVSPGATRTRREWYEEG